VAAFETVRRRKDGTDVPVFLSVGPIRDDEGRIVGASKIARDITAKKRGEAYLKTLQDELAHVARLSAMGQMSTAIAHELNQPLAAIANYVKAARRLLAADVPAPAQLATARDAMERAGEQTIRAGSIIRSLREFVEKRDSIRAMVDLNRIICETVMLSGAGHHGVAIRLDLAADLPEVPADKVQIEQVLLNLLRNAMEAMAGQQRREITILSRKSGEMARIEVADCGPGVAPHILEKPFQPFVTTKEKGMGVGLNMCRSLVEAHGGAIRILSRPEPGAVFEILLPLTEAERESA
jgi:two-component system sensor kinase FixL